MSSVDDHFDIGEEDMYATTENHSEYLFSIVNKLSVRNAQYWLFLPTL